MIKSNLKNAEGIPTGAIYGFANALVNLLEKEQPDYLAVVWDTHAPTFRHEMDENYKANRPPQPEELQTAIPLMKEMIDLFGFKNIEKDGYEADDLIGTLAMEAKHENVTVFMVTPDKDFMQLVGENIFMYKPLYRGDGFDVINSDAVVEYFGVTPDSVIDILALIGDTSDNIPGVPGIGKKGAAKIIREYGSLENAIYEASSMKSKRAREGLMNHKEQAFKSRDMIVINTNVPETISWKELKWHGVDNDNLVSFFKRMQFRSLAQKIASAEDGMLGTIRKSLDNGDQGSLFDVNSEAITEKNSFNAENTGSSAANTESAYESLNLDTADYHTVTDLKTLQNCVDALKGAEAWSFDTETTSANPQKAELLGIALSDKKSRGWYIHAANFNKKELLEKLNPLFMCENVRKAAHHFKYDYRVLGRFGIEVKGKCFDTMLAAYLIDSGQKMDMNSLAQGYLNYDPVSIESLIGVKGQKQKSMQEIPLEEVAPYACEDADITLQLYKVLKEKLREMEVTDLAEDIEFPLARVLGDMETNGFKLDLDLLDSFSEELERDIQSLRDQIYRLTGEEFNINSTQQLGKVLFEKMKLPSRKKTATGKYSTSEQVLANLAAEYDVAAKILEYRGLSKLKSTYVDAFPKLVDERTGRIHSTFNQHVTATGRLSSTQPNMQNIPVRTERGRGIRKAFVAEEGYRILAVDYSQIELRIIASMSGDQAMIRAFREDEDIHSRTAAELFGVDDIENVGREQRRKAKEVNFGIPYGVSAFGLAQRLGISNKEGKAMIDAYFNRFPGIKEFIDKTTEFARENGYVQTLSGRRRYIPDIHSRNPNIRGFAERTAVNMPIQGTAADLIKIAMIGVDRAIKAENLNTRMLLQVHDELVFEIPEREIDTTPQRIRSIMEQAMDLNVPLKAEIGISDNWLDAH